MRDPDLVFRAQLAAASLESAWHRWRVVHGLAADPMPTVSSYVGYSLEEPWGQPRVVFGLAAEDAEQLAGLLERHDCVGPVYAAVATWPGAMDGPARSAQVAPLPVPRQAPPVAADAPDETAEVSAIRRPDRIDRDDRSDRSDQVDPEDRSGSLGGYDEPLFRQAAAAMREAALKRKSASNGRPADSPETGGSGQSPGPGPALSPAPAQGQIAAPDEAAPDEAALGEGVTSPPPHLDADDGNRPPAGGADFFERSPEDEPMGSLAQAATAARAAAEARIKAALTEYRSRTGDMHPYPDYDDEIDELDAAEPGPRPAPEPWPASAADNAEPAATATEPPTDLTMPAIYATEVLEPLPRQEPGHEPRQEHTQEPTQEQAQQLDQEPGSAAASGAVAHAADQPGQEITSEHDAEFPPDDQPSGSTASLNRRNRLSRAYPIPRLSRTKRPGPVPAPDGQG
jgi:hypothetical protein